MEANLVGACEGSTDAVGVAVGAAVGAAVGVAVGSETSVFVGEGLGIEVGLGLRAPDGFWVSGNGVGLSLGRLVGLLVVMLGAPDGLWVSPPDIDVGLTLGELVGLWVVALGAPDGLWVSAPGIDVGLTLGELVGLLVGMLKLFSTTDSQNRKASAVASLLMPLSDWSLLTWNVFVAAAVGFSWLSIAVPLAVPLSTAGAALAEASITSRSKNKNKSEFLRLIAVEYLTPFQSRLGAFGKNMIPEKNE
jgi:hypothetical protein